MIPAHQDDLLNSWKEIAAYLNRGIRTVQRWEAELGLPVRRPRGQSRSAVIAMRSEIDEWLKRCPVSENGEPRVAERLQLISGKPRLPITPLIVRSHELRDTLCRSRDELGASLNKLMVTLEEMLGPRTSGF